VTLLENYDGWQGEMKIGIQMSQVTCGDEFCRGFRKACTIWDGTYRYHNNEHLSRVLAFRAGEKIRKPNACLGLYFDSPFGLYTHDGSATIAHNTGKHCGNLY
jgi:hypothetical protein